MAVFNESTFWCALPCATMIWSTPNHGGLSIKWMGTASHYGNLKKTQFKSYSFSISYGVARILFKSSLRNGNQIPRTWQMRTRFLIDHIHIRLLSECWTWSIDYLNTLVSLTMETSFKVRWTEAMHCETCVNGNNTTVLPCDYLYLAHDYPYWERSWDISPLG